MSELKSTVAISLPRDEQNAPANNSGVQTTNTLRDGESPHLISTERDGYSASHLGIAGRIAATFIDSKLTPLVVIAFVLLGAAAVVLLPREEEPQIKVPMIDVMVAMPGSTAKEIEERATRPMEKLLWEVPGVEYLYSTSRDSESLVIVRFKVGEDPERSLVKITEKLRSNFDRIPMGVTMPIVKPKSIDDVPILALTFHSARYDHLTLRRLAAQVDESIKQVPLVAETTLLGGSRRAVRVMLDPVKLASRNLSPAGLVPMLQQANRQFRAGGLTTGNNEVLVETGAFLKTAEEVGNVVIGVFSGRPVYLREVAEIVDGGEEPTQYVFHGNKTNDEPAVTLSIAKRPGANAISVADEVLQKIELLKGSVIPADVSVSITRNYGETAAEKSNELLLHMGIAVFSVAILIWLTLGWRESGIVAVAIPATLALTLLVFYLYGFTLNRITLFALIFSIGILVDDAIVVVENIVRHFHLPQNKGRKWSAIAVEAVGEVGNPTILATFAVIAAVLPMAFVGGLMGPYMRPIPIGASAAMFWSLLIAFIVTPWASIRILRWGKKYRSDGVMENGSVGNQNSTTPALHYSSAPQHHSSHEHPEDFFTKLYRKMMGPLIHSSGWRWVFLIGITVLLLGSMGTVGIGWVKVKMLPFDNKSEFQVILNMPEGSSLEKTTAVAREMAAAIRTEPEVTDYQVYAGVASPYNFNGLVRHYFMRRGANVADIQVNLVNKHERKAQSHDIAKRVRPAVAAIAERYGARVAIAEVPPGPPVLQTLVAEIYGPDDEARLKLAEKVKAIFKSTPGVVDVDWYIEADQQKARFIIDKEKAALHGISAATISQTLKIAVDGENVDLLHQPEEKEDVNIRLELPRSAKTTPEELLALRVRSGDANALPEPGASGSPLVPLRELVKVEHVTVEKSRYHKNLMPVTYVIGDVAGVVESPVYAIFQMNEALKKLDTREFGGSGAELKILNASMPFSDDEPAMKWDGEWHITIEVFRDLGAAFGACLILIYVLMVGWFRSFITPAIVMIAIPFSLVGILPAHGMLDAFFTATSMIGFMAGGGIVVRNSIILVDFIELRVREGMPLSEAVIDAGAVRFRPMLLTAMAVVVGAAVILADPIFQGLAIALMAGEIASLFISRMAVPVLYYMANKHRLS
ncbi:MAG TPA: multidrug transporter AcrB [Verrucomicrobiales bacterium]|nr:multidrug transporter AcrB [Verrucomicrobiales bacterium]HRJ07085.1 efflux RND transporter permease subunit [Prosthecobacter sp.]HRK12836.1 efflux RND transporter permease subunit [Prosthecobacter sp.]